MEECNHSLVPVSGNMLGCETCGKISIKMTRGQMDAWMEENWFTTLSIVMLTVPERSEVFSKLWTEVRRQTFNCHKDHPILGRIETVVVSGKLRSKGGLSIGSKRQLGLGNASGKYVCWLDDDDGISGNYVETILRLCQDDKDVCTFKSFVKVPNFWCIVDMNLKNKEDHQIHAGIVQRRPYHVCAFKKEVIKDCKFPDQNWDEDAGFLEQALPLCHTQAKSESIIHEYRNFNSLAK